MNRPRPLPIVCPVWDGEWSDYPDGIRVSMSDGNTIVYRREIKQPAPVLKGLLDKFNETCYGGYKYKEKCVGKRMGRRHG